MAKTMNTEIVPFGKYKDRPVEAMLADQNYVEWIAGQPGIMVMLQNRYPALFNIITVGAPQISDTPEHNKLQAMFLDREFQLGSSRFVLVKALKQLAPIGRQKSRQRRKYYYGKPANLHKKAWKNPSPT